jgi:zinc/manganese transport system permease protein
MMDGGIFSYGFMLNAFAAAGVVAVVSGLVGYFLVLRGQIFAGHALAHVGFTGATGAVLLGAPPLAGLALVTVVSGSLMGLLGERVQHRDVAVGMVLSLALGFGLLFLHFFTAGATQAMSLLFGNILGVDAATVWVLVAQAVLVVLCLAGLARPLLFASLQPELAEARGVPLRLVSTLFLALVGLATAGCAQIVGVLLVFTLTVGPAAAAARLTRSVVPGVVVAAALALAEAWFGIVLAFYTDWPTSFCITMLSGLVYMVALALSAVF